MKKKESRGFSQISEAGQSEQEATGALGLFCSDKIWGFAPRAELLRVAFGSSERKNVFTGLASGLPKNAKVKLQISSFP